MKKAILIVNPSSGGEQATEFEAEAKKKLESYFDEVEVRHTEKKDDATNFAREAAESHYDSVFIMGGDGTVNEGINGLAELEYRPKLGFFPLGTVNDLARALSIPLDPHESIENLSFDDTTPLDIGKINDNYFMNVVAIGTIPEAINDTGVEEKTKLGKIAYFIHGIKSLSNLKPYNFILRVDGEELDVQTSTILIGLSNSIGGFETLFPQAKVNDGKLHLIYLKENSLLDTIITIPDLLSGIYKETDRVGYIQSDNIEIELADNEESLTTNVDGDEGVELPIKIKVLPSHLEVYRGSR